MITFSLFFSGCAVAAILQNTVPAATSAVDAVKQAEALAAEHHLEQANELLTEYLRHDLTNSTVLVVLGRIQLSQGMSEDALRSFEKVLSVDPESKDAREGEVKAAIVAALAEQKIGLDGDALLYLIRARKLVPDSPELLFAFGMQAERMRIFKDADEALEKAHTLAPQDLRILYALSHVQMDEQKMAEAEANLKAYLQQKPDDATAHYGLGLLLHMVLRNDEAKAEFRRSIRQQIHYPAVFQVAENCAVATPLPPRPIVDTQHPRGSSTIHCGRAAQLPQQGPATGQDTQLLCQTRTCRATQRPCNLLQSDA